MLIYLKIKSGDDFIKAPTSVEKYRGVDFESLKSGSVQYDELPFGNIHSWFVDELEEEIVGLVTMGDLEGVKRKISESSKEPKYLAGVRFCKDGFVMQKYASTAGGPFDGYSLLNVAIFHGHEDLAKYLINECGMNPNDKCYANSIWTAGLPTDVAHTEGRSAEFPRLRQGFETLKNLVEGDGVVTTVQLEGHRSGKVNDTVFHIAARVLDHGLRGEMFGFFAEKVPEDASKKSYFLVPIHLPVEEKEALGKAPFFMLCRNMAVKSASVDIFKRDLDLLKGCGGFEEYNSTPEYKSLLSNLPANLKETFASCFGPSNTPAISGLSSARLAGCEVGLEKK